jgi:Icc-related predicted phosphoesterase
LACEHIEGRGMSTSSDVVRIAAMSDVHYARTSAGALHAVFEQVTQEADVLVLGGDLTDYGLTEEAKLLAKDLTSTLKIPIVGVLGNHDFEAGQQEEITKVLTDAGVRMLDGDTCEFHGVGFAGVRGFCGGFGRGALGAWGEPIIKQFVHEALQEVLKLESALARLKTVHRIAVIHYAPVRDTVQGEPLEIYPFLGSSRLEEPLTRYSVSAVFHGHAHRGSPEGRTSSGIPVFNVCLPLLRTLYPDRPPFRLFEVPRAVGPGDDGRGGDLTIERRHGGRRITDVGPGALVERTPSLGHGS